jgi:microcystin-dependent protein
MAEPFLAEIRIFGFNFAPRDWAFCDGQILPINQNQSLYSLLGTTYGGDGRTSFALPDLRSRTPIHVGNGHALGRKSGTEQVTLATGHLPAHTHSMQGSTGDATALSPAGGVPADVTNVTGVEQYATTADVDMDAGNIASTGGQPHNNMQPYLALSFAIALQGVFPSRN